jgi:hypothetical protein
MTGGAKAARPAKIAKARPGTKRAEVRPALRSAKVRPATKSASASRPARIAKAERAQPPAPAANAAREKSSSAKSAPRKGAAAPIEPPARSSAASAPETFAGSAIATSVTAAPDAADEPPARDEMVATRDVGRLLRYGERLGTDTIDIRMLPLQLHVGSGSLAVFDPASPETWHVLDRPIGRGAFRVMLSIARPDGGAGADAARPERLAAVVLHAGRPPIARWTVAHFRGQAKPRSPDALPRTAATTGWIALLDAGDGPPGVLALPPSTGLVPIEVPLTDGRRAIALPCSRGEFTAYWAVDAADRPICVVLDLDAFPHEAWNARPARAT